jgi:hypothetical protein
MNDGSGWVVVDQVGANETTYQATDLTPNTTYEFRVTAIGDGGESETSNVVTVTTSKRAPLPVVDPQIANVWATKVDVNWRQIETYAQEYALEISRDGGNTFREYQRRGRWADDGSERFDGRAEGLKAGTHYWVRVVSIADGQRVVTGWLEFATKKS